MDKSVFGHGFRVTIPGIQMSDLAGFTNLLTQMLAILGLSAAGYGQRH
jgi:hypothetical protein